MNTKIIQSFSILMEKMKTTKEPGWQFKIKNYKKAIDILSISPDISNLYQATAILSSIGLKNPIRLLEKINEILLTGELQLAKLAELDESVIAVKHLTTIPEIGPASALKLFKLGYKTVSDLKNLDKDVLNKLLNRKQLIGLKYYDDLLCRIQRDEMTEIETYLNTQIMDGMSLTITGSYRRGKASSGDIDCLISHSDSECLIKFIKKLQKTGFLVDSFACGKSKFIGICKLKDTFRHIDILYSSPNQYPFAILYFTGSKEFNVNMRLNAITKGYTLSEHGLGIDGLSSPIKTENDIFTFLDIPYIKPEDR